MRWLAVLLLPFSAGGAGAHALPGTIAMLDFHRDDVGLELVMPLDGGALYRLAADAAVADDSAASR
jgi:hypothetical protein